MALRPRGIGTNTQSFLSEENQTVFNLRGRYKMYMNDISVYVGGKKQILGVDYLETSETSITFMNQLDPLSVVEIVWLEVPRVATDDHSYTHARGGTDELTARDIRDSVQVVNVKDFGAIGNGIADDTKAMQTAISYAKFFQAEEVYFPTGKYKVGLVTNFTNVALVGTGVQFVGTHQYKMLSTGILYNQLQDIGIHQINKNKGLLDQTYMSEEFLQQIVGTAALHSIPADGSITTKKLANKAVTLEKIDDYAMSVLQSKLPVLAEDPTDPIIGQMWLIDEE